MPTYNYACTQCSFVFEATRSIKDETTPHCAKCHSPTKKVPIAAEGGFILKGSGWYKDLGKGATERNI